MYNILVVDDDKEIVESIEIFLKNEGYNVYKAYNGMEALDVLVNNDVHLILMDILANGSNQLQLDIYCLL